MRSSSRLLLSRIGHQHQPYSPVVRHSANFIRFYTSQNPSNEERSGVWNVVKKCSSWIKNKLEVRVTVPEGKAYVIERHGAYINTLTSGIHSLGSRRDKVAHVHSLKEQTICIPHHPAFTKDYVAISFDGCIGVKIVDPKLASYSLEEPMQTVIVFTQAFARVQIAQMTLDETFEKRDTLNERILMEINNDVKDYGLECVRFEIRDIILPTYLKEMMEKHAIQKREIRASILAHKVENQKMIKTAEEKKMSTMRAALAESEAILRKAHAEAEKISEMAKRLKTGEGLKAEQLELAKIFARISTGEIVLPEETSKKR